MEVINHNQRQAEVLDINGAKVCFFIKHYFFQCQLLTSFHLRNDVKNLGIKAFLMILCNINVYQIKTVAIKDMPTIVIVIKIVKHIFCK